MRHILRPGRRAAPLLLGPVLGTLLVAGCGGPAPVGVAADQGTLPPATTNATTSTEPTPTPAPLPATTPAPSSAPATAAELQRSVDGGSEPWLLDPAEVAVSYASTAHGWADAQALPRPGGTTVDVAEGGKKLTLTLAQPGRSGPGGVWVVTGEAPG